MRVCVNGEVILAYPRQFCRLGDALINNADEYYIVSLVNEETGDKMFRSISRLFCPHNLSSFLVFNFLVGREQCILDYLIDHQIELYFGGEEAEYIRKHSDIAVLEMPI